MVYSSQTETQRQNHAELEYSCVNTDRSLKFTNNKAPGLAL